MSITIRNHGPENDPTARNAMRRTVFLSQDGVVLCATLRGLDELELLTPSLAGERSLAELYPGLTDVGLGALRIGLQCLTSTGWLADVPTLDPRTTILRWTDAGRLAADHREHYVGLGSFLSGFASTADDAWSKPWSPEQTERFLGLLEPACERWGLEDLPGELADLVRAHLDAGLIVPTMLWLHETDRLGDEGPSLSSDEASEGMGRLLRALGWLAADGGWTQSGQQARAFALNFGGVATYLPLLARLPEFYRGELTIGTDPQEDSPEWHVHRELNLRISAAAHRRYFVDSDPIFVELFNREPIDDQPRFVADMGCGNGSWLIHLHELIKDRTRRGESLGSNPLLMVGIDPDRGALAQARRNLESAGVPALLIPGDVTDPNGLSATLAEHDLAIDDGLHIRAFIDHERSYLGSDEPARVQGWASGAYIDGAGGPLAGKAVEQDLVAHLRRWEPHVRKHGMVVLEAHCVAPGIASRHLGSLHSVAFDAHQAYSKQYPVDHPAFIRCCQLAGLQPVGHWERRYPSNRPFVSISLNRLLAAESEPPLPAINPGCTRRDSWHPEPGADLEDGRALHEMLFTAGDIRYPAMWCTGPTGFVVRGALETIEDRLANANRGDTIRVLDYGAGTGTATIELLKACRERGLERRLADREATLELHLVDLPSSWLAQGYELLRDCEWTRFHSLRSAGGGFRPLPDVVGRETMDVAMANMVFHLIPPRALPRAVEGLSETLVPAGRLLWSAPDLGPPRPESVLLHDPNRALRERWLELLKGSVPEDAPDQRSDGTGAVPPAVEAAIKRARESLDEDALSAAQDRADRRILPRPLAADLTAALESHFAGEIELRTYEMLNEDIVRGLLVPSNQREYLSEIADRSLREDVVRELMLGDVLPAMRAGPAATSLGLNFHWTLGAFARKR
ncbi:MAG: class I SAM-dependent methyltransferase [Solirubrobacterales bacterium]